MLNVNRKTLDKALAAVMLASVLMTSTGCNKGSQYMLNKIKLTETERTWKCPEDKYAELLGSYEGAECPGAMVVATDEDIVYLYCENALEKDGKTLVSQDTVFDIASCSKTFTAVCVLQLAEKGQLNLYDTIDKYFPEYENGKMITVLDLLHMRSGIPDYMNNPDPFWGVEGADVVNKLLSDILNDKVSDEEFLNALYKAPLLSEPGTKYSYSNTNYRLLAFIIEHVTGMSYSDYVERNIFDKCGMKKTTSMESGDMTYVPVNFDDLVHYGFTDENGYPVCPGNSRGDGGIHSCLTDMVAFDRALFGGKLLSADSMNILLTDEDGYCCGLSQTKTGYTHSGSSLTCSAENKITESEEYGHVYVIKLYHDSNEPADDFADIDPAAGTAFAKGTYKDGVYSNACAELTMNVPEEYIAFGASELDWVRLDALAYCVDDEDRQYESARIYDVFLYDGNGSGSVIEVTYLNTDIAFPDENNVTEEFYLDDYEARLIARNEADDEGDSMERRDTVSVMLGGKDYLRTTIARGPDESFKQYFYVRKVDDNLFCMIMISDLSGNPPEYYEGMFE